jgi:hypothetical protein
MKITYNRSVPEALIPILDERFRHIKEAFPKWCHELIVSYEHDNPEGNTLTADGVFEYRYAEICVYDFFFNDIHWEESLMHELMHIMFSPYTKRVERVLNTLLSETPIANYIKSELLSEEEGVAQDFAVFANYLTNTKKDVKVQE